jgi:hypothetical protein
MHQKLTKHGRFGKQNNQLPTKSHVELKDNSNMDKWYSRMQVQFYILKSDKADSNFRLESEKKLVFFVGVA